jgi:tyrosinase
MTITFDLELPPASVMDGLRRADLTFYGLDHSGSSYRALIFFNNPSADITTPTDTTSGYVTRFAVFGHGGCFGESGHCEVVGPVNAFDRNHPHQLQPATRIVTVTDAVQTLVASGATSVTVTVVPVVRKSALAKESDADTVLVIDQVALHTYA